ncbi:uncharacterized protein LOC124281892 [Haliotis rubra]|uniref:uncharacterized protein LOC124281892 n=1 Tax=Haliotis rubra TaxID=36100 RepID=UPI001EE5B2A2|nr:uncharacterized protein LOC124281892 [Haliotis rubra]
MEDEEACLLTPTEAETQRRWDEEYRRRQEEFQRRAQTALDRRRYLKQKVTDLNTRWRGLEDRRQARERDYFRRCVTTYRQNTL